MANNVTAKVVGEKLQIAGMCTATHRPYIVVVDHAAWKKWQGGIPVQEAFPDLSRAEREFLKSGITPDEWDAMFGVEER